MGDERARTRPKRRSRTAAVLLTAVVVGGAVYFMQQSRITSLRKSLSESQQDVDDVEDQLAAVQESLAAAEEEIVIVRGQLAEAKQIARQAEKQAENAGQPAQGNAPETKKLPDGKYFGKFTYVQSPTHISVDMEDLLYGREAQKTAVNDGAIPPGTKLPNGYYIRNVSSESRVFPVTRNVTVQILAEAGSSEKKTIEMPGLVKRWSNPMQKYKYLRTGEFDFWLKNQRIVRIVQHYFP